MRGLLCVKVPLLFPIGKWIQNKMQQNKIKPKWDAKEEEKKNQMVTLGLFSEGQPAMQVNCRTQQGLQAPGWMARVLHNAV